jgi:hypothetical protein
MVYEKSRIGQSVGPGKRHVPVLDSEPSRKVGRFAAQDRSHRVGPAPTVGFRFMSYSRNSPRIRGRFTGVGAISGSSADLTLLNLATGGAPVFCETWHPD